MPPTEEKKPFNSGKRHPSTVAIMPLEVVLNKYKKEVQWEKTFKPYYKVVKDAA